MAVLMTYHKLVERDSKNIDIHWKGEKVYKINPRESYKNQNFFQQLLQ